MCREDEPAPPARARAITRRTALAGLSAAPFATLLPASRRLQSSPMPEIVRRSAWGPGLAVNGRLEPETVKFLIVHHTLDPDSDYTADDVPRLLTGMYRYHTGPSKGWADLAYNFLVDKFGTIYEGRTGSIDGPVQGSATGGNQGFTQLCCFIGDYSASPPPEVALDSMLRLLAWLADRYGVETRPGATVQFESRGSNRWPAGTTVSTPTICGHRDMSMTECPGDATYPLVVDTFAARVSLLRAAALPSATTSPAPSTSAPSSEEPSGSAVTEPRSTGRTAEPDGSNDRSAGDAVGTGVGWPAWAWTGTVVSAAAVAGALRWRHRRRESVPPGGVPVAGSTAASTSPLRRARIGGRNLAWHVTSAWPPEHVARLGRELDGLDGELESDDRPLRTVLAETVLPLIRRLGPPAVHEGAGIVVVLTDPAEAAVLLIGEARAWNDRDRGDELTPNGITVLPEGVTEVQVQAASTEGPTVVGVRAP